MLSYRKNSNQVMITNRVRRYQIKKNRLERIVRNLLGQLGYRRTLLSLVFVSDDRLKCLNQKYLNHAWNTDVLAFSFRPVLQNRRRNKAEVSSTREAPRFLGELVISPQRAEVQAKHFQVPLQEELMRYVCHGILHLSGFSDQTKHERERMRRAENRLLNRAVGFQSVV